MLRRARKPPRLAECDTEDNAQHPLNALYQRFRLCGREATRVLIRNPAETPEAPVVCCLECIELNNLVEDYEALSYTWGPPTPYRTLPQRKIIPWLCRRHQGIRPASRLAGGRSADYQLRC